MPIKRRLEIFLVKLGQLNNMINKTKVCRAHDSSKEWRSPNGHY